MFCSRFDINFAPIPWTISKEPSYSNKVTEHVFTIHRTLITTNHKRDVVNVLHYQEINFAFWGDTSAFY